MKVTIEISETEADLLAVLLEDANHPLRDSRVEAVIYDLIDHAQQGVYRPGSWERPWLTSVFGEDWLARLEPGDPHGRSGGERIFQRPKKADGR